MANRFDSSGVSAVLGRQGSNEGSRGSKRSRQGVARSVEQFQPGLAGPPSGALGNPLGTPPILKGRKGQQIDNRSDLSLKVAELEDKVNSQDRINSYLMDQLNSFESKIKSIGSRAATPGRGGIDSVNASEILNRMVLLEQQVQSEQRQKFEVADRLQHAESAYLEMQEYLKTQQTETEIQTVKSALQQNLASGQIEKVKNKEKNQALFTEVVRIGEQTEQTVKFLKELALGTENKMKDLESRITTGESALQNVGQGVQENTTLAIKHNSSIETIDGSTKRMSEEMKTYIVSMQAELKHTNELQINDLVGRLLQEQNERITGLEGLRNALEVKERMLNERANVDKEEIKDRVHGLNNHVHSEFQRKDEALSNLHDLVDQQQKNSIAAIKAEESNRYQDTFEVRSDLNQIYDQIRNELDSFKVQSTTLTDKITETIRSEIESRLHAEKELKNLIHAMIKGVMQEISMVKDATEGFQAKTGNDLKEIQMGFAQKADLLSRYIDDQVQSMTEESNQNHSKTKEIITALAESIKQNIINTEKWKGEASKKFAKQETGLQHTKTDLNKQITRSEGRIFTQIKEVQEALDMNLTTNSTNMNERINQISDIIDTGFENMENTVNDTKIVLEGAITAYNDEMDERLVQLQEETNKIAKDGEANQTDLEKLSEEILGQQEGINAKMSTIESQTLVRCATEKATREQNLAKMKIEIENKFQNTDERLHYLSERLNEEEMVQQGNDDRNLEKFEDIKQEYATIQDTIEEMKLENTHLQDVVGEVKETSTVAQNRIKEVHSEIEGFTEGMDTVKQNITINQDNIEDIRAEVNTITETTKEEVGEVKAQLDVLKDEVATNKEQQAHDERVLESYIALQNTVALVENQEIRQIVNGTRGDIDQMLEDNATINEKLNKQIDSVKEEQEGMKKESEAMVNDTLSRKILNLQEELSGRNEDNWMKSLKLAQEHMKGDDSPQKAGPPKDKLVAMNNKIYKLANEEDSEPKPRLQVKK